MADKLSRTERPCSYWAFQPQSQQGRLGQPEHFAFFQGYISVVQQHLGLSPARLNGEVWLEPGVKAALKACADGPSWPPLRLAAVCCHSRVIAAANLCFSSWLAIWFSSILRGDSSPAPLGCFAFQRKDASGRCSRRSFYLRGLE